MGLYDTLASLDDKADIRKSGQDHPEILDEEPNIDPPVKDGPTSNLQTEEDVLNRAKRAKKLKDNYNHKETYSLEIAGSIETYSKLLVDPDSCRAFLDWSLRNSIPNPVACGHHCTLISSKDFHEYYPRGILNSPIVVRPTTFKWHAFENNKESPFKTLVLMFDSPKVQRLHDMCLSRGIIHSFPQFHKHITISYKFPKHLNIEDLPLPNFAFSLYREESPPWIDNYQDLVTYPTEPQTRIEASLAISDCSLNPSELASHMKNPIFKAFYARKVSK